MIHKRKRASTKAAPKRLTRARSVAGIRTQRLTNPGGGVSVEEVRRGLPIKVLDELASTLRVDRTDLADVIGTSLRTLQRKAGGERLGAAASDRLACAAYPCSG
ncbi:MAG: antitoxin Xre-like helix-turn-helix domain-containing protein, partial [Steroidobacteraceae bacterium]